MSRIPVVAGRPQIVSANTPDQKVIRSQVGTLSYANAEGSGTLAVGDSLTISGDTVLSIAAGRGYAFVTDVFGSPDSVTEASLPDTAVKTTEMDAVTAARTRLGWDAAAHAPKQLPVDVVDLRAEWDDIRPWSTSLGAAVAFSSADEGKYVMWSNNGGTAFDCAKIASVSGGIATVTKVDGSAFTAGFTVTNQRIKWGKDAGAAITAALAELAADGVPEKTARLAGHYCCATRVYVPQGVYLKGAGWGSTYPPLNNIGAMVRSGLCLQALPSLNSDLVRLTPLAADGSGRYCFGPGGMSDLLLMGPETLANNYTVNAGSGFAARDSGGHYVYMQDGSRLSNVHAIGFYDDGFQFLAPLFPGWLDHLRAFYNGRYGINITLTDPNAQGVHLLNPSADGNGTAGLYFKGFDSHSSITITNLKSEAADLFTNPRGSSSYQANGVIFDECDGTPVTINGLTHIASTDGTWGSTHAPGPAMTLRSAADKRPAISYSGVGVRVHQDQVTGTADAVTIRDEVAGVDIPRTVKAGHWPPDTVRSPAEAISTGQATADRRFVDGAATMSTQTLRGSIFESRKTETYTKIRTRCSTIGGTPTLARVGIYTVAANGDLTRVAAAASDTAKLQSTNPEDWTLSSSYKLLAGKRYAIVALVVTSNTAPQLAAINPTTGGTIMAEAPRQSFSVAGQTDLPSSIAAGSLTDTANQPYFELAP